MVSYIFVIYNNGSKDTKTTDIKLILKDFFHLTLLI